MTSIAGLGAEEYISLTTFRRDGSGVATPVWVMADHDHLYVITDATSGKAKRLANFARVMVAPCDMRGTVTGASVDATAELLDATGRSLSQHDGTVRIIPSPTAAGTYFVRALLADGRISLLRLIDL